LSKKSKVVAIVVSAGSGRRMGTDKTFLRLLDKPLIAWPLSVLQNCEPVDEIILVLHENKIEKGRELVNKYGFTKVKTICLGGGLRQDSVKNGLSQIKGCEWVIIHDGARPYLTEKLVLDGLDAAGQTGAAVAAVAVKDTIKQCNDGELVQKTLERKNLRAVQTPQVFRFDIIKKAYITVNEEVTDDSSLVEKAGFKVKLYPGDHNNIKITTPEDIALAEFIAKNR